MTPLFLYQYFNNTMLCQPVAHQPIGLLSIPQFEDT